MAFGKVVGVTLLAMLHCLQVGSVPVLRCSSNKIIAWLVQLQYVMVNIVCHVMVMCPMT